MTIEKDLAIRLVDTIEALYLENLVLRATLMMYQKYSPQLGPWEKLVEDGKTNQGAISQIQSTFSPVRRRIAEDSGLAEAIEQFLKVAPPSTEMN